MSFTFPLSKPIGSLGGNAPTFSYTALTVVLGGRTYDLLNLITETKLYRRGNGLDVEVALSSLPSGVTAVTPLIVDIRGTITL